MPNFWNDPNRDFGNGLLDFGGALLHRPCKHYRCWCRGKVAKQAYKESLKQALKGKIAGKINQAIKKHKKASRKALTSSIR